MKKTLSFDELLKPYETIEYIKPTPKTSTPEQFLNDVKDPRGRKDWRVDTSGITDIQIVAKINEACDIIKSYQYINCKEFSKITGITYVTAINMANKYGLPHIKKDVSRATIYVGPHDSVKEWLMNNKKYIATALASAIKKAKKAELLK